MPTATGNVTVTATYDGHTFTSPTVYMSFASIWAQDSTSRDIDSGPTVSDYILPIRSSDVVTMPVYAGFRPSWEWASLPIDWAALNGIVPYPEYKDMSACAGFSCMTIYNDYNPQLVIPGAVTELEPAWASCTPGLAGAFDPPHTLQGAAEAAAPAPSPTIFTTSTMTPHDPPPTPVPPPEPVSVPKPAQPSPTGSGGSSGGDPGSNPSSPSHSGGNGSGGSGASSSGDPSAHPPAPPSDPGENGRGGTGDLSSGSSGGATPPKGSGGSQVGGSGNGGNPGGSSGGSNPDAGGAIASILGGGDPGGSSGSNPSGNSGGAGGNSGGAARQGSAGGSSQGSGGSSGGNGGTNAGTGPAGGSEGNSAPSNDGGASDPSNSGSDAAANGAGAGAGGIIASMIGGSDSSASPPSGENSDSGSSAGSSPEGGQGSNHNNGGTGQANGGDPGQDPGFASNPGASSSSSSGGANPINGNPAADQNGVSSSDNGSGSQQHGGAESFDAVFTQGSQTYTVVASNGNIVVGSSTLTPGAVFNGQTVSQVPAGFALGTSTYEFSNLPDVVATNPPAASSEAVFTQNGHAYTAIESNGAIVIGTSTIKPGGIFNGQVVATASNGLVVGSQTYALSAEDSAITGAPAPSEIEEAVFSQDGHVYTAIESDGSIIIGSSTITPGGKFNGQVITTASNGLVVGSSTYSFSAADPSITGAIPPGATEEAVFTQNGHVYTAFEKSGEIIVDGSTLRPGETFHGQVISESGNDMIIGSSTIPLSPIPSSTSTGLGVPTGPSGAGASAQDSPSNSNEAWSGKRVSWLTLIFVLTAAHGLVMIL
ncbi:MAG: hypothetical protein M1820_005365 [Bogoriella megaspora]|nr:MAG: hypothetical protein M1820_005365 [Bogoriella megaspora]